MLESSFLENSRIHIVFKMAIIEWESQAIETFASEERSIFFFEEVLEELIEKEVVLFLPQDFEHGSSMLGFMAWVTSDEVFHTKTISISRRVLFWRVIFIIDRHIKKERLVVL